MTVYTASYVRIDGKKVKHDILKMADTPRKRMFTKITTCLNPECENYARELERKAKICQSCEAHTYISAVLTNVLTCVNRNCANYGDELKQEMEICSLCGAKTKPLAFAFNPRLAPMAIALAVASTIIFTFVFIYMHNYMGVDMTGESGKPSIIAEVLSVIKNIILLISVIMGFLSKSKLAFIITAIICVFVLYWGNLFIHFILR